MIERLTPVLRSRAFEVGGVVVGLSLLGLVLREALADTENLRFSPIPAVVAVVLFGLSWLGLSVAWTVLAAERPDSELAYRWLRSQLFRYVPGGIWAPVSRLVEMDGEPRARSKLLLLEILSILGVATGGGAVVAVVVLGWQWWFAVAGSAVLLALVVGFVYRLGRSLRVLSTWLAVLTASLGCYLLASGFSQDAVAPGVGFWDAAAAGLLSWAVGYVVFFAPSGVGAKEWAYLGILASHQTATTAGGALAARVLFIIGEVVALVCVTIARRRLLSRAEGRDSAAAAVDNDAFDLDAQ